MTTTVSNIYEDATREKRGKTSRFCFNVIRQTPTGRVGEIRRFEDRDEAERERAKVVLSS